MGFYCRRQGSNWKESMMFALLLKSNNPAKMAEPAKSRQNPSSSQKPAHHNFSSIGWWFQSEESRFGKRSNVLEQFQSTHDEQILRTTEVWRLAQKDFHQVWLASEAKKLHLLQAAGGKTGGRRCTWADHVCLNERQRQSFWTHDIHLAREGTKFYLAIWNSQNLVIGNSQLQICIAQYHSHRINI